MYILKNAWRSVVRARGRNILVGIIVLVIAVSSCVALSIGEAAKQAEETSKEGLVITGQISLNRQAMMAGKENREAMREALAGVESLSLEDMEKYAESSYVKQFYYTSAVSLNAGGDLEAVDVSGAEETTEDGMETEIPSDMARPDDMQQKEVMGGGRMGNQGDFTVTGYSCDDAMTGFLNGSSTITDGEMFPENDTDYNCIISSELAVYNGLETGDTITLTNPNDEESSYDFTISGIYESAQSSDSAGNMMENFSPGFTAANQIYTSYENLASIADSLAGMQINGTYTFASVEDYEAFKEETEEALGENYTVSSQDVSAYEQSLMPLENLSKYASYFLAVVLVIGGIILVVLNIFNIRERKYEIGVLAAIGMKKGKIALQFITELLCVTFIAIVIGTGVGAAVSVPVTNQLLEQQIENTAQQSEEQAENFGRAPGGKMGNMDPALGSMPGRGFGATATEYISQVNEATNLTVVFQLMGIGLLLTIAAGCVAVIFILRYDPLRILSSRD